MTTLTNNFQGAASGTALTTGNSAAGGNAFDNIFIGTNATLAYDSTRAAHGTQSCKVATGATSTTSLAEWTTSMGTQATVWYRMYCYLAGTPTPAFRAYTARSGASHAGSVIFSGTQITLSVGTGFTTAVTFTAQPPLNKWFRFEGLVTGNASTGVISGSLYTAADSPVPAETHTVSGQNTTGTLTQYWFGQGNSASSSGPFWLDDVGISSAGPLGPVIVQRGASIVPSLIAAGAIR